VKRAPLVFRTIALLLALASSSARADVPADAWQEPAAPACLASDTAAADRSALDAAPVVCDAIRKLARAIPDDRHTLSAKEINWLIPDVQYAAFLPAALGERFAVTPLFATTFVRLDQLVRVSTSRQGAQFGSWWTTRRQVSDGHGNLMSPTAIRSILALPATPRYIAFATSVITRVHGFVGVAAPAFGESGGGLEFWFPATCVDIDRTESFAAEPDDASTLDPGDTRAKRTGTVQSPYINAHAHCVDPPVPLVDVQG